MCIKILTAVSVCLLLCQCGHRPIVLTSSQFGANVTGTSQTSPNKFSVGYDRSEFAHMPTGVGESGIAGSLDTEFRLFSGAAISEVLVTGKAANNIGQDKDFVERESSISPPSRNKIISTNTRSNLGIEAAGSDGAGPSLNFGFRRAVAAIFPPLRNGDKDLPSTYADLTIHAAGINGSTMEPQGVADSRWLAKEETTPTIGSRTVQRIASGRAAELLSKEAKVSTFVRKQVRGDAQSPAPGAGN